MNPLASVRAAPPLSWVGLMPATPSPCEWAPGGPAQGVHEKHALLPWNERQSGHLVTFLLVLLLSVSNSAVPIQIQPEPLTARLAGLPSLSPGTMCRLLVVFLYLF